MLQAMSARGRSTTLDARIILLAGLLDALALPFVHRLEETALLAALACATLMLEGHFGRAGVLAAQFVGCEALACAGALVVAGSPASALGATLTAAGVLGERAVPVLGYVFALSRIGSGELVSALMRARVPQAAAIGLASLLRFVPALGQTFEAMRRASLFRGDGFRAKSLARHPARSARNYLLPFLARLSCVADDLAAALCARGVGMGGAATTDVRDLRAKPRDLAALAVLALSYGAALAWRCL